MVIKHSHQIKPEPKDNKVNRCDSWTLIDRFMFLFCIGFSFFSRIYKLNHPAKTVFDEVHFGKFASLYIKQEFHFDVHPPFGKMLFALVAYFAGYDGSFSFETIGLDYPNTVPFTFMGLAAALAGTLIAPIAFLIMKEMKFSRISNLFGICLLMFDTALVTQTRLILLDAFLMLFMLLALYSWIKFEHLSSVNIDYQSAKWLCICGLFLAATTGVKLVGLFTISFIGFLSLKKISHLRASQNQIIKHMGIYLMFLILLPSLLFFGFYECHFKILTKSGPGDKFMSKAFQQTLINPKDIDEAQPLVYGSKVNLLNTAEYSYLNLHTGEPGTEYSISIKNDPKNIWIILPVDGIEEFGRSVKPFEKIRLFHSQTNSFLIVKKLFSSFDEPESAMEISTTTDPREFEKTFWLLEPFDQSEMIITDISSIKLKHDHSQLYLSNHRSGLFKQRKIIGTKEFHSLWIFGAPDFTRNVPDTKIFQLSSFQKFTELFLKQISVNRKLKKIHRFKSRPVTWPFVFRGISYWRGSPTERIYLLGNVFVWYIAISGIYLTFLFLLIDFITTKFKKNFFTAESKKVLHEKSKVFFTAWAIHYLPFFFMDRSLYLHHYLPAFIFSAFCSASLVDFAACYIKPKWILLFVIPAIVMSFAFFVWFSPLVYAIKVDMDRMNRMNWFPTWDLVWSTIKIQ